MHHAGDGMGRHPEFAYTAEQWASLRDNQLEFTEIADLIHVYNNTVIQNQLEYEDFRGKDADDIADDYYDAADDIYGSLEYPDSSDSDYASRLSSYLSSQIQLITCGNRETTMWRTGTSRSWNMTRQRRVW